MNSNIELNQLIFSPPIVLTFDRVKQASEEETSLSSYLSRKTFLVSREDYMPHPMI